MGVVGLTWAQVLECNYGMRSTRGRIATIEAALHFRQDTVSADSRVLSRHSDNGTAAESLDLGL